ncbi:MAG: FAD-dependent oxidoreductase, partial [Sphingomicrobium sp.]
GGPEVARLNAASKPTLSNPPPDFAERSFLRPRGAIHLSRGEWPELPAGVSAERLDRAALEQRVPGLRPEWVRGLIEPGCADIDVARLHAVYLRQFKRHGGDVRTSARVVGAEHASGSWRIAFADGSRLSCGVVVNAAGAWADQLADLCGVKRIGLGAYRRTMVQLRVRKSGLAALPLIVDSDGQFYFKGEGDRSIWLSPHDEIASEPCDCAPEEIDIATAIRRFQSVVDWPVERVERSWAGLRTFAPDRLPVYGFDPAAEAFFWCAGQGGFGIQSAPAAAALSAALLLKAVLPDDLQALDPKIFSPSRFQSSGGDEWP